MGPALLPLSYLFRFGVWARGLGYDAHVFKITRLGVPVVSVGNIKVGGTGKTPFCRWLAERLSRRGMRPAIVSRGYGGRCRGPLLVGGGGRVSTSAEEAGDEAVMLAKTGAAAVVIGRDRVAAGRFAVGQARADCLVLDDGFQHRRLGRDVDIVLIDGSERKSRLLPAGPLREPISALARAEIVLRTVKSCGPLGAGESGRLGLPPLAQRSALGPAHAYDRLATVHFIPQCLVASEGGRWEERALAEVAGRRGIVVAGVADPTPFYHWLQEWELEIDSVIEKPDHHNYTVADWQVMAREAERVDFVVTTEKDLVKLERFPFARGKLVALRMGVRVPEEEVLIDEILGRVVHGA